MNLIIINFPNRRMFIVFFLKEKKENNYFLYVLFIANLISKWLLVHRLEIKCEEDLTFNKRKCGYQICTGYGYTQSLTIKFPLLDNISLVAWQSEGCPSGGAERQISLNPYTFGTYFFLQILVLIIRYKCGCIFF